MEEQKSKLKKYISRFSRKHELRDDEDMFELGIVNSLFAMQLVMFVESELGVTLENSELDMANFQSINAIMRLIESKMPLAE
ncbi:acyl carrier protein [Paenibacillus sp. chi10]|uniref:Acyl carrier protein n=1 Tax=Paenibacillus suaedae TaxID=3077233 RepID=A0AAJ2JUT7_9BACL|nr:MULTISPECIES: acyl carrier protein [unclassified Paenibacillus]MDT8977096.1 acyl carrier protein [Paenibacillus sp. chi10]GAV14219.1 phosphopantetheine-binding [Paenibacillus sp. NAIST15-1]